MSDDTPRKVSRDLQCELDDDRKLEIGQQIATMGAEAQQLEEQRSAINTKLRPLNKDLKAAIRTLARGTEERTLLCEVIERPGHQIAFRRPDTGEIFGARAMTPEERQLKLEGGDWLEETQKALERAKAEQAKAKGGKAAAGAAAGDDDEDDGDDGDSNVVPLAGRTGNRKAARKPRGGGKGGKGKKR